MAVKIRFLGGVKTVTGSSHLVHNDRTQVLLDAGLYQGRRDEFYAVNSTFSFAPRQLDAFVLSHAHVDHCGNIPSLIRKGMRCKIYATHATRDLTRLMLEDAAKIQEEDIKYVNKINKRLGLPLRNLLYNQKDVSNAIRRIHPVPYDKSIMIAKDFHLVLLDAGHILGSSIIVLEIKDNDRVIKVGYAVDLGRNNLPMLNNPEIPKGLDYLILESTYGGRQHTPVEDAKGHLKEVVNRTIARGGKIIIPAFSLERTQEVIYLLDELLKEKAIPAIPVYVDSPLSAQITEAFIFHADYMNSKAAHAIQHGQNPFEFINLRFVASQDESKGLNMDKRPMVIIAGSGMCESGRVLHHLKNNIEDSRNTVLVVGYMAKDTLGKKIVDKSKIVRIFGVEHELNAEVVVMNSLSAHADKNDLANFVFESLPLKRIFLVHGDPEQSQILADTLSASGLNVHIPDIEEEVELI